MDSLSPEILSVIFAHISSTKTKISRYSTVSRQWQELVEQQTFSTISLPSTDLADFRRIVCSPRRRCLLTRIELGIILPPFKRHDSESAEDESDDEVDDGRNNEQTRNEIFTRSVRELLNILRSWEIEDSIVKSAAPLALQILVALKAGREWDSVRQFEESLLRLDLDEDEELDYMERRAHFSTIATTPWKARGASILSIASSFRRLETLHVELYDNEKRNLESRRQQRYEMAKQIGQLAVDHLQQVTFNLDQRPTANEDFPIDNILLPDEPSEDHLSTAIHRLSQAPNLTTLRVPGFALISPSLFYPAHPNINHSLEWPNLECLEVEFDMKTPSGEWYFLPTPHVPNDDEDTEGEDDEEESDEEDEDDDDLQDWELAERREQAAMREVGEYPAKPTRNTPDPTKLYPLFRAVSKAAVCMPKLRYLRVATKFVDVNRRYCELWFNAPGITCWRDAQVANEQRSIEEVRRQWRLFWNVTGLKADDEILQIWRDGESRKGRDLTTYELS